MKGHLKHISLFFSLFFTIIYLSAQRADPDDAAEHFKFKNYIDALVVYKKLIEKEPKNPEYKLKAGICIIYQARDKKEAIPLLESAAESSIDPDALYYLGQAYHFTLDLDKALETYKKYKAQNKGNFLGDIDRLIEMAENAKKIIPAPVDVTFENLGDNINTEYPDYYPFVTPDESMLVFTSRRRGVVGNAREFDGHYSSDIFISKVVNGDFEKAKGAGLFVNTEYDDQAVGLSYDGQMLFIYLDNIKEYGDIYQATASKGKFRNKEKFSEAINSKEFESAATISADGNTLFFASSRAGGLGGKDIYMTRKLPTGDWAQPQNLGPTINTPYDEDFPNLFYDGSTLYFSSKGHNSIGGYDLFKSKWNPEENTWSTPENIGYPINTPEDNMCISFTEDKRHAYVSMWRPDSKGFEDIYRITFEDIGAKQTVIKSKILTPSGEIVKDAFISVLDNRTQEEVGQYTPNSKTGSFILALLPGSYNIMIEVDGYPPYTEDIIVKGKSDFQDFLMKEFTLTTTP